MTFLTKWLNHRRRNKLSRGQALVEFALILPVLLLVVAGIFDFGRALFTYSEVSNAVREGTRYAAVDPTNCAEIKVRAQSMLSLAPGGGISITVEVETPNAYGGFDSVVCTTSTYPGNITTDDRIRISVSANVELLTLSMIGPLFGQSGGVQLPISYTAARSVVPPEGISTGPTTTSRPTKTLVVPAVPGIPSTFTATSNCNSQYNVSFAWSVPTPGPVDGYYIFRRPGDTLIATIPDGTQTSLSNVSGTGVAANTSTTFYIVAYNAVGSSGQSADAIVTCGAASTNTPGPTPTNTSTPTFTPTPTNTPMPTFTPLPTATATQVPTNTLCYSLTTVITPTSSGTVAASPTGACVGGKYLPGTVISLTATGGSGYNFSSWSGVISSTANPVSFTIATTSTVTAKFVTQPSLTIAFVTNYPARKQRGANQTMFVKVKVTYLGVAVNDATVLLLTPYAGSSLSYIPASIGLYGLGSTCWSAPSSSNTYVTVQASKLGYQAALISAFTDSNASTTGCP